MPLYTFSPLTGDALVPPDLTSPPAEVFTEPELTTAPQDTEQPTTAWETETETTVAQPSSAPPSAAQGGMNPFLTALLIIIPVLIVAAAVLVGAIMIRKNKSNSCG